jgi:hypothetical protein
MVLLFSTFGYSQDETVEISHQLNGGLRMSLFRSFPLGDNILGSGHEAKNVGLDLLLVIPITEHGFGFGMGFQSISFKAVDAEFLGDIKSSVATLYYLQGHFQQVLSNNMILEVFMGGGLHYIQASQENITNQKGSAFKMGFNTKYRLTKNFEVVGGIHYVGGYFSVQAPKEFDSYFNKTHQLQIHLGFTLL